MENEIRSKVIRSHLRGTKGSRRYRQLKQSIAKAGSSRVDPAWNQEDYFHDRLVVLIEDNRPLTVPLKTHMVVGVSSKVRDQARSRKVRNLVADHVDDALEGEYVVDSARLGMGVHREALKQATAEWLPEALSKCSRSEREAVLEWMANRGEFSPDWPAGGAKRKACARAFVRLAHFAPKDLRAHWDAIRAQD